MKKIVSIILLLCLVCLSYTVYATEPTTQASANIKFETVTEENIVTIKISTGEFEGLEAESVMSASMTLVYDEAHISKVSGKTTDNWKITISDETKRVLLENDKANPNTQFAEITFELRDIKEGATGVVSIRDFNISDGNLLDETYATYSANYTIKPQDNDDDNNNEENNNVQNEITNEVANETTNETNKENIVINTTGSNKENGSTVNNSKDNTISPDSKLPQTGVNVFFIVLIIAIVAFAVVKLVKYKDIEIK